MAIRLIASDLDGTLMAPDHMTVTQRTKDALLAMHEKGAKIAIATGRTLSFIENVTAQIPFVDYVIYSNGASVYDRAKNPLFIRIIFHPMILPPPLKCFRTIPFTITFMQAGKSLSRTAEKNISAISKCPMNL